MKQKMKVLQIAATYIGTVIGAGFATGREIVEFFVTSGAWGILGILISGFCFIWIGSKIMRISSREHLQTYDQFNTFLFGKKIGRLVNGIFLASLLGTTSVTISGVGATFREQLGLAENIGIALILLLCFVTLLKGVKGIVTVSSLIVPAVILFGIMICLLTFINKQQHQTALVVPHLPIIHLIGKAVLDSLIYTSLNLLTAQVILVPLGNEINNETLLKWGGIIGGAGLTVVLLTSFYVLTQLPYADQINIPMAESARQIGTYLHFFYVIVVFGAILSAVVGNVFGLALQLHEWFKVPFSIMVTIILSICLVFSHIDFNTFLAIFYRMSGIIGLFIFFYLVFLPFPKKRPH